MSWQKILAQGFKSTSELLRFLDLPEDLGSKDAERLFKTRVPKRFAERMEKGNPADPLLAQVLASLQETLEVNTYTKDPLDEESTAKNGLLHKYRGRVLLTLTGVCAVNCRYCFRRHFPYEKNNPGRKGWLQALDYINKDCSISEVILSGGDPLMVSNTVLADFIKQLTQIKHVKTLRFHSRIPIVLPERIDQEFINMMSEETSLAKVMVFHCNHPNEIDSSVEEICKKLIDVGFCLLNQSVLLHRVNDNPQTLAKLSSELFKCRILPYYLHVLDKVDGAAHFDLSETKALEIFHELQTLIPGYLVPRLAREVPGEESKTLIN